MFAGAGVAALLAGVALSYQIALARVPQHRATLERLVQAHTGLDVRFNALTLQWGWYGPEVVFRRVELGEPGASSALLRAPQLIVGFDVWRTLQTGQLQAGRITLVSPDIDFTRAREPREPGAAAGSAGTSGFTRVLQRWSGGRIELQGGTLRIPDPAGSRNAMSVQLRRAALRRANREWTAAVQILLPERLGREARFALRMTGDAPTLAALTGTLEFQGRRLVLASWREILRSHWRYASRLPESGSGDVNFVLQIAQGAVRGGEGKATVAGVRLGPARAEGAALALGYLRGEWKLQRRDAAWHLQVDDLAFGADGRTAKPASLALDVSYERTHVQGRLDATRVVPLIDIARWLAPDTPLGGDLRIDGAVRDLQFDWDIARPEGRRLQAALELEGASLASASGRFALDGLDAGVAASETELTVDLESPSARFAPERLGDEPLTDLQIDSRLTVARDASGWQLATDRLSIRSGDARLVLMGHVRPDADGEIDARLEHAEVPVLKRIFDRESAAALGEAALRVSSGRVESAEIHLTRDPRGDSAPWTSRGTLVLREAAIAADERFPEIEAIDGRLDWQGTTVRARIDRARGGPLRLTSAQAEWRADEKRLVQLSGRASARFEEALEWLAAYPALQAHVPQLSEGPRLRGDAELDLRVTAASASRRRADSASPVAVRLRAELDHGEILTAPDIPAVESVRGTLVLDDGRLRRSTMTGSWMGGPVSLLLTGRGAGVVVQAQGTLDAAMLAETFGVDGAAVSGRTRWQGEILYTPATESRAAQWHAAATTTLAGISSGLPAPLAKLEDTVTPVQIVLDGTPDAADVRVALEGRAHAIFNLEGEAQGGWRIARGTVHVGPGAASPPVRPAIVIDGRLAQADAARYASAWREAVIDRDLPPIDATLTVDRLIVAGRPFDDVTIDAKRQGNAGFVAQLEAPSLVGTIIWPMAADAEPTDIRLTRLDVAPPSAGTAQVARVAASRSPEASDDGLASVVRAIGRNARVSVDSFAWNGRLLGRLTAEVRPRAAGFVVESLHLSGNEVDARANADCEASVESCRIAFELESRDAATALLAFGLRDEIAARNAVLTGTLDWHAEADRSWLGSIEGSLSLEIEQGELRAATDATTAPFALLTMPALLGSAEGVPHGALPFTRLEGDFQVRDGEATTSNLHFDGETEILVRGRTGLTARDYDYTAWVLRGEERMPAALRRFGATPGVAAAWLSLRDLFAGSGDRSRAVLRLSGPWSAPVVTPVVEGKKR